MPMQRYELNHEYLEEVWSDKIKSVKGLDLKTSQGALCLLDHCGDISIVKGSDLTELKKVCSILKK